MLKNIGQAIELGGIAKGFLLDKIAWKIKYEGFENALINLGGTITSIGVKRKVGIRNPFTSIKNNNSKTFAELEIIDEDVVKSGKVSSITIESSKEDEQFFDKAKSTVINEIISEQSIDGQTVSGATMSSNGIIDAVSNALGISYVNPNSTITKNKGHGRMR